MIRKIACMLILFSILYTTVFAHTAQIQNTGQNQYKSIRLTPEIYQNANSDLSDLLIKDTDGNTVPYFINTSYQREYKEEKSYPMILTDSYVKDHAFYFDFRLAEKVSSDAIATSIALTTQNTNFAKDIIVYGSYDGIHWDKVQNDTLYSVQGKTKLEIAFQKPQKYTHYRFQLSNNLEKIKFDRIDLQYNFEKSEKSYFVEMILPTYTIETKNKQTYIHIAGLKNLKLAEITIETDSIFKRMAQTPFAVKEIYNLNFSDSSYKDLTIVLKGQLNKEDIFTITIQNKDDKPINITAIVATYYADELIFDGNNATDFTVTFEASDMAVAPQYDIASYQSDVLKQNIDRLSFGEILLGKTTQTSVDYTLIFNITVIIITIILAFIIILKLKKRQ